MSTQETIAAMTPVIPGIVVPAITILILTYSNRFSTLSNKIREFRKKADDSHIKQIKILMRRVFLVRYMLGFGIGGLILSTLAMSTILAGFKGIGYILTMSSYTAVVISLVYALIDVYISTQALTIEIDDKKIDD